MAKCAVQSVVALAVATPQKTSNLLRKRNKISRKEILLLSNQKFIRVSGRQANCSTSRDVIARSLAAKKDIVSVSNWEYLVRVRASALVASIVLQREQARDTTTIDCINRSVLS